MNLLKLFTLNTLNEAMKIENIYIYGNCLLYEELVMRLRTLSTEIFRIFPTPFDFSLFSRNRIIHRVEPEISERREAEIRLCSKTS